MSIEGISFIDLVLGGPRVILGVGTGGCLAMAGSGLGSIGGSPKMIMIVLSKISVFRSA